VIGYGVFGTVREAFKISSTLTSGELRPYAVKSIIKSKVERKLELLRRELEILKTVDHPNIIKLFEVYEDKKYLHLVTELCTGGDLLDHLLKKGHLSEKEVLSFIYKTLSAIHYLHNLNICHRDIKPENLLLFSEDSDDLKLVDFGMSNFMKEEDLSTFAGTPYYISPEVIQGCYGRECDVWSLGVLTYFLLSGRQPFHSSSVPEVFSNILTGNFSFNFPVWDNISVMTKDLINKMLTVHPLSRLSVTQALKHEVFLQNLENSKIKPQVFTSLKKFKAPSKLWQETMTIFVKNFTIGQISLLNSAFNEIDQDKTGWITANDILIAMMKNNCNLAYEEFAKLVRNIEYIGKGKLNYSQFLVVAMDRKKEINEEQLWMLFKHFDLDDNGKISIEELRYVMEKSGFGMSDGEIDEVIEEFKVRAPQAMNFDEFLEFMRCVTDEAVSEIASFRGTRRTTLKQHYTTIIRKSSKDVIFEANSLQ
jgi:calcium-dependent protein kinase